MSGHLYQLKVGDYIGQIVRIDGPWNTYGRVIRYRTTGFHLIRGLGHTKPNETLITPRKRQ